MVCCQMTAYHCLCQKYDYNYINRSSPLGSAVGITYIDSISDLKINIFSWDGTISGSPVLSDKDGQFLGYCNSRNLYDSIGRVAINGDSMAVGFFQNYLFQFLPQNEGLGNRGNCAFIPISDSILYLFYASAELWVGAPNFAVNFMEKGQKLTSYSDGLYLTKVRLNANHRLYILPSEKHILLLDDLFQFQSLMLCKRANGLDWWLIIPKALNSKASRLLIHPDGEIELMDDIEFSDQYWRVRSASSFAFSPDGSHLARLIVRSDTMFEHIFELFTFNRCEGSVHRILLDSFPLTPRFSSSGDVEFSESGRFLYIAIGEIILQMDIEDPDFFVHRDTIAQWDGFLYTFLAPLFDGMWRLPNGKILVNSAVSTPYMHYINKPDLPGAECMFQQRAIMLPVDPLNEPYGVDIEALPNFPPFRMKALAEPCSNSITGEKPEASIILFPNPGDETVTLSNASGYDVNVFNAQGQRCLQFKVPFDEEIFQISLDAQAPGVYFFILRDETGQFVVERKFVKL